MYNDKSPKALPSKEEFEKAALPLHVNIMHNPPPIDQVAAAEQAPGFMGHVVMTPSVFTTRSYGWKGSKKLLVELENSSGPEKTKVWVQLNINAVSLFLIRQSLLSDFLIRLCS